MRGLKTYSKHSQSTNDFTDRFSFFTKNFTTSSTTWLKEKIRLNTVSHFLVDHNNGISNYQIVPQKSILSTRMAPSTGPKTKPRITSVTSTLRSFCPSQQQLVYCVRLRLDRSWSTVGKTKYTKCLAVLKPFLICVRRCSYEFGQYILIYIIHCYVYHEKLYFVCTTVPPRRNLTPLAFAACPSLFSKQWVFVSRKLRSPHSAGEHVTTGGCRGLFSIREGHAFSMFVVVHVTPRSILYLHTSLLHAIPRIELGLLFINWILVRLNFYSGSL